MELTSKTFPRCLTRTSALLLMLISMSSGETLACLSVKKIKKGLQLNLRYKIKRKLKTNLFFIAELFQF